MKQDTSMRLAKWAIQRMQREGGYIILDVKKLQKDDSYASAVIREGMNLDNGGWLQWAEVPITEVTHVVEVAIRYAMLLNDGSIRMGFNKPKPIIVD